MRALTEKKRTKQAGKRILQRTVVSTSVLFEPPGRAGDEGSALHEGRNKQDIRFLVKSKHVLIKEVSLLCCSYFALENVGAASQKWSRSQPETLDRNASSIQRNQEGSTEVGCQLPISQNFRGSNREFVNFPFWTIPFRTFTIFD